MTLSAREAKPVFIQRDLIDPPNLPCRRGFFKDLDGRLSGLGCIDPFMVYIAPAVRRVQASDLIGAYRPVGQEYTAS